MAQVKIDHVIIAVHNLDSASEKFQDLGFTIKDGRLHENGLLNKHIKFQDGSSVELMTLMSNPTDELSQTYHDFLKESEGGVFLALTAPIDDVQIAAELLGIESNFIQTKAFKYLTFTDHELHNVFFIEYLHPIVDSDSILTHDNEAQKISSVTIQSGEKLKNLLIQIGATEKEDHSLLLDGSSVIIRDFTTEIQRILAIEIDTNNRLRHSYNLFGIEFTIN